MHARPNHQTIKVSNDKTVAEETKSALMWRAVILAGFHIQVQDDRNHGMLWDSDYPDRRFSAGYRQTCLVSPPDTTTLGPWHHCDAASCRYDVNGRDKRIYSFFFKELHGITWMLKT